MNFFTYGGFSPFPRPTAYGVGLEEPLELPRKFCPSSLLWFLPARLPSEGAISRGSAHRVISHYRPPGSTAGIMKRGPYPQIPDPIATRGRRREIRTGRHTRYLIRVADIQAARGRRPGRRIPRVGAIPTRALWPGDIRGATRANLAHAAPTLRWAHRRGYGGAWIAEWVLSR